MKTFSKCLQILSNRNINTVFILPNDTVYFYFIIPNTTTIHTHIQLTMSAVYFKTLTWQYLQSIIT